MNTLSPVQNPANQAGAYNAPQARRVEQYAGQTGATPEISVVIPVFNEEDNVELLYSKLVSALTELGRSWEAILVDDGSKDKSFKKLEAIASGDSRIKVVRFVKNFGQGFNFNSVYFFRSPISLCFSIEVTNLHDSVFLLIEY